MIVNLHQALNWYSNIILFFSLKIVNWCSKVILKTSAVVLCDSLLYWLHGRRNQPCTLRYLWVNNINILLTFKAFVPASRREGTIILYYIYLQVNLRPHFWCWVKDSQSLAENSELQLCLCSLRLWVSLCWPVLSHSLR